MPPSQNDARAPPASTRLLLDMAERALRVPAGKLAVALHLSRLRPPAPRPHHSRIARAMLADTAHRYCGQVFPLSNGDLILLCSAPMDEGRLVGGQSSPLGLAESFGRLFGADAPDGERLTSVWRLDTDGDAFRTYVASRNGDAPAEPGVAESAGSAAGVAALEQLVATAHLPDLLRQQTAVRLVMGRNLPLSSRLAPMFREISFSFAALARPLDTAEAMADPFLFRHFAARLDARILEYLHADMEAGGKLTRGALRQKLPLHFNLTLEAIVSPAFARLAQYARGIGARVGIEVSLMDAVADPPLMEYAMRLLALADFPLILDGLDANTLAMTRPAALAPSLVKLRWTPAFADAPPALLATLRDTITRLGPDRIVLQNAEREDALVWGQAQGIMRFQGYYLDAVQAAGRIAVCHSARACTLRQCIARAETLSPVIRSGCGNPGLLDLAPQPATAAPDGAKPGAAKVGVAPAVAAPFGAAPLRTTVVDVRHPAH